MLVMDSASSQQTTRSNNRECRGWRDEINGNLIRFANKICKCNKRASVKISESDDNPNKLYYCCMDSRHGYGYFKFWIPSPNDFNKGEIFEGVGTCQANYELLLNIQKELTDLKLLMQNAHKTMRKCSCMKICFLSMFFFICAIIVLIMGVILAAK